MKSSPQLWIVALLLQQSLVSRADDRITNAMSPVVSFQYLNGFDQPGSTLASPIVSYQFQNTLSRSEMANSSPIVSYQYLDWAGFDVLGLIGSPRVSYFYHGGDPLILHNPTSQIARLGTNVTFSVAVLGTPPFSFNWQHDAKTLGATSATNLSLTNVQLTDSGDYRVEVADAYGVRTSSIAHLNVYLPPNSAQPPPPTAAVTTELPPASLTARPRKPGNTNLIVYSGGGQVDRSKKTIVMTHGWNSSSDKWPRDMSNNLREKYDNCINILAWDWRDDAHDLLSYAKSRTCNQGEALGAELLCVLGGNYSETIHFIGHSLGTMVNCHAADFLHGDAKSTEAALFKYDPARTHITLLDEAEVANITLASPALLVNWDAYTDSINCGFAKVIPKQSAWVDNYISEVGLLHTEAANVLLWRRSSLSLVALHGYAYDWYSLTVLAPFDSLMGHRWSFENHSAGGAPLRDTYFLQSLNPNVSELQVSEISSTTANLLAGGYVLGANRLVAYSTVQTYQGANSLGSVVLAKYLDSIEYVGEFLANVSENFLPLNGQPVFVGTANSTPAYFLQPWESPTTQADWDTEFSLRSASVPSGSSANLGSDESDGGSGDTNSTVYAWLPVQIPDGTVWMSFQFKLEAAVTNEYITMGISNETCFVLESEFIDEGVWNTSPVIEIARYAGQQVRLFFSLNASVAPNGKLSVRSVQFFIPPTPQLSIEKGGITALVSWPITAIGWRLQSAVTPDPFDEWTTWTNIPMVWDYRNIVTNSLQESSRFFRLVR